MNDSDSPSPESHTLVVQQHFMRHQQALLAYVLSLVPSLPDAQDIVQDVFLVVTRKASLWTEGTSFFAWACAVARYEILHYHRASKGRGVPLDSDVVQLFSADGSAEERLAEKIEWLKECLQRLSPKASELVLLRYHAGQKPDDIATQVHWSVNAVRVALTRARQTLRDCLDRKLATESND